MRYAARKIRSLWLRNICSSPGRTVSPLITVILACEICIVACTWVRCSSHLNDEREAELLTALRTDFQGLGQNTAADLRKFRKNSLPAPVFRLPLTACPFPLRVAISRLAMHNSPADHAHRTADHVQCLHLFCRPAYGRRAFREGGH